jgi:WD40 repeat protein
MNGSTLAFEHVFGTTEVLGAPVQDALLFSDRRNLVFPVGQSVALHNVEENTEHFLAAGGKDGVRRCTAMAVSPDRANVAVCLRVEAHRDIGSGTGRGAAVHQVIAVFAQGRNKDPRVPVQRITHGARGSFVSCCFSGSADATASSDCTLLGALGMEPECALVVWRWASGKQVAAVSTGMPFLRIRFNPLSNFQVTTSSSEVLMKWRLVDNSLKGAAVPLIDDATGMALTHVKRPATTLASASGGGMRFGAAIEVIDHVWTVGADNRLAVLCKSNILVFQNLDGTCVFHHSVDVDALSLSTATIVSAARGFATMSLEGHMHVYTRPVMEVREAEAAAAAAAALAAEAAGESGEGEHAAPAKRKKDSVTEDDHFVCTRKYRCAGGEGASFSSAGFAISPDLEKMYVVSGSRQLVKFDTTGLLAAGDGSNVVGDGHMPEDPDALEEAGDESEVVDLVGKPFVDGGVHCGPIAALDVAAQRPLVATAGADGFIRVWDYAARECEIAVQLPEEALSIAIHPSGLLLFVGFKARGQMFNLLGSQRSVARGRSADGEGGASRRISSALHSLHEETTLRRCAAARFSNGGHMLACAMGHTVEILDAWTLRKLYTFSAHVGKVLSVHWSHDDRELFSAGKDGCMHAWSLESGRKIEDVELSVKNCAFSALAANRFGSAATLIEALALVAANKAATAEAAREAGAGAGGAPAAGSALKSSAPAAVEDDDAEEKAGEAALVEAMAAMPAMCVAAAGSDGRLYVVRQEGNCKFEIEHDRMQPDSVSLAITQLVLCDEHNALFAGTSTGAVRVYAWNALRDAAIAKSGDAGALIEDGEEEAVLKAEMLCEVQLHSAGVTQLSLSPDGSRLFSTGNDGSLFVCNVVEMVQGMEKASAKHVADIRATHAISQKVVLVARATIEAQSEKVLELEKMVLELRSKASFDLRMQTNEHATVLAEAAKERDRAVKEVEDKYQALQERHEEGKHQFRLQKEQIERDHLEVIKLSEGRYEARLASEIERVDALSEEMATVRMECDAVLRKRETKLHADMEEIRAQSAVEISQLRVTIEGLVQQAAQKHAEHTEHLTQLDIDYDQMTNESQVKQVGLLKEQSELRGERERDLVHQRNKTHQWKQKAAILNEKWQASVADCKELRARAAHLEARLKHTEANLDGRGESLEDREKTIRDLRQQNRTLQSYRLVLQERIQRLEAENEEATGGVGELEEIRMQMMEELAVRLRCALRCAASVAVPFARCCFLPDTLAHALTPGLRLRTATKQDNFKERKLKDRLLQNRELKMGVLKKDVKKLRAELRDKERTVLAIENDLTNLLDVSNKASSMHTVVAAVQKLFRTHVKGEGDAAGGHGSGTRTGDDALSAAEAMQQKEYLQRACDVLKQQLSQAEAGAAKQKKKTMQENSMLIEECNMLRKEKSTFGGEIQVLQEKLKQARRNMKQLLARSKEAERSRTPASRSAKRSTASKGADMAGSAGPGSLATTRPGLAIASASKTMPAFGVRSLSGGAGPAPSGREAEAVQIAASLEKQVRAPPTTTTSIIAAMLSPDVLRRSLRSCSLTPHGALPLYRPPSPVSSNS